MTVNDRHLGFNTASGTEALSVTGNTTGQDTANPVFCAPSGGISRFVLTRLISFWPCNKSLIYQNVRSRWLVLGWFLYAFLWTST